MMKKKSVQSKTQLIAVACVASTVLLFSSCGSDDKEIHHLPPHQETFRQEPGPLNPCYNPNGFNPNQNCNGESSSEQNPVWSFLNGKWEGSMRGSNGAVDENQNQFNGPKVFFHLGARDPDRNGNVYYVELDIPGIGNVSGYMELVLNAHEGRASDGNRTYSYQWESVSQDINLGNNIDSHARVLVTIALKHMGDNHFQPYPSQSSIRIKDCHDFSSCRQFDYVRAFDVRVERKSQ